MIAYKYRSARGTKDGNGKDVFERDIELLSQDTIYVPTVDQLNDPAEALVDTEIYNLQTKFLKRYLNQETANRTERSIQDLLKSIHRSGVYSLSREITNELMWAYYASGHYGYAIIFDTDVLTNSFENGLWGGMYEMDVKYSSKLPRFGISIIDLGIEELLSCLVGTKSKSWEHEAEHRLFFEKGGQCIKVDYRAFKGFVFGCRMNDEDISYVMKTFSGRNFEYYKIILKGDSYNLSLAPLEDRFPTSKSYCPNIVEYNIENLLEMDEYEQGVGYKYKPFVEEALHEVSTEPFVTAISHIVVSDDQKYPHILIWAKWNQEGVIKKARRFEYDVVRGHLVKKK